MAGKKESSSPKADKKGNIGMSKERKEKRRKLMMSLKMIQKIILVLPSVEIQNSAVMTINNQSRLTNRISSTSWLMKEFKRFDREIE